MQEGRAYTRTPLSLLSASDCPISREEASSAPRRENLSANPIERLDIFSNFALFSDEDRDRDLDNLSPYSIFKMLLRYIWERQRSPSELEAERLRKIRVLMSMR
ncbi:hypothetical protein HS088_TW21G01384 [Tripterygium wilfordii]|uniref:Uncharacterized protein n=1 Tax=Tripterygium wilfordii TaxID=458696 RepID=A0A7J7C5K1_TRIWF|nr:hypothetical protein HS088_TW21G01384 [Tripterygium wilfordii]